MKRFIVGYHAIEETLIHQKQCKGKLYIVNANRNKFEKLLPLLKHHAVTTSFVNSRDMVHIFEQHKITYNRNPDVLLELFATSRSVSEKEIGSRDSFSFGQKLEELKAAERQQNLILFLDKITDPQNLGAILRSCDQLSVDLVVLPSHKSAKGSPTVLTASSGASEYVPCVLVPNLNEALKSAKKYDFWIFGADMDGDPVMEVDLRGNVGLVLGSEGKGLSPLVKKNCDRIVRIPSSGHVDSFNVSVATGILLYEIRRQQKYYS